MKKLNYEELVAVEKMLQCICKKYENIAQITKTPSSMLDQQDYVRATQTLTFYNKKRDQVIDEMESRIKDIFD